MLFEAYNYENMYDSLVYLVGAEGSEVWMTVFEVYAVVGYKVSYTVVAAL